MIGTKQQAKVKSLWGRFLRAGMSNSLETVEQISYLILLRFLDLQDALAAAAARRKGKKHVSAFANAPGARWSEFMKADSQTMLEIVRDSAFPMLKDPNVVGETVAAATKDAVFAIQKPALLAMAVLAIEDLNLGDLRDETQAEVYEVILSHTSMFGSTGRFGTPQHIVRAVVEVVDPQLGQSICDPVAGASGFLIASHQWLLKAYTPRRSVKVDPDGSWHKLTGRLLGNDKRKWAQLKGDLFAGYDNDATMVRIGLVNMLLHGIRQPNLHAQDTLSSGFNPMERKFDIVFATPPFISNVRRSDVNRNVFKLTTDKTELLYIELCLAMLKRGGRCAIIVPEEVLFGSSNAHKQLRQYLVVKNRLEAVVGLPPSAFKPFTGIKTAILFITKGGSTKRVWFYEVTADGYTLDDKRSFDPENDNLRYVPQWFRIRVKKQRERWASPLAEKVSAEQSWSADLLDIGARNFSLAPGAYRPLAADAEQEDPLQIIARVLSLEDLIKQKLVSIKKRFEGVADA